MNVFHLVPRCAMQILALKGGRNEVEKGENIGDGTLEPTLLFGPTMHFVSEICKEPIPNIFTQQTFIKPTECSECGYWVRKKRLYRT